jgi:hypothetical protein
MKLITHKKRKTQKIKKKKKRRKQPSKNHQQGRISSMVHYPKVIKRRKTSLQVEQRISRTVSPEQRKHHHANLHKQIPPEKSQHDVQTLGKGPQRHLTQ